MSPETVFTLVGIAARNATALGLHRRLDSFGLSSAELAQRQRVFWIIYIVEKDLSIRIGRPSAIDDDDVDFGALYEHGGDELPLSFGEPEDRVDFYPFQSLCSLAIIQSKTFRELYAAKARANTASQRLESISRLDTELQDWKEKFPTQIRPEQPLQCKPEDRSQVLMLHFGYYHCLISIHRVNAHHELWAAEGEDVVEDPSATDSPRSFIKDPEEGASPMQQRANSSYALCLAAAGSILHLSVNYLDVGMDPRNMLIILAPYFPMFAFLTLFTHVLQCPLDPRADGDLYLMSGALNGLNRLLIGEDVSVFSFMTGVIGEFFTIAREHVLNCRSRSSLTTRPNFETRQTQTTTQADDSRKISQQPGPVYGVSQPVAPFFSAPVVNAAPSGQFPANTPALELNPPTAAAYTSEMPYTFADTNPPAFDADSFASGFAPGFSNPNASQGVTMVDDAFFLAEYGDWDWSS
jgi:hypothetical protein